MSYYAKAIDILTNPETDFRDIVIQIAKMNPQAVVDAVGFNPWERKCIPLIRADKKIGAIKLCRELTGIPLKEAKDAVEELMERMEKMEQME